MPTGHPVRLGERVSPALPPCCLPGSSLTPLPQGHCLGGSFVSLAGLLSALSALVPERGIRDPLCGAGLRPIHKETSACPSPTHPCTYLPEPRPGHWLLPPLDPSGLGTVLQVGGLCLSGVCECQPCPGTPGLVVGEPPCWGVRSILVLRCFHRGVSQPRPLDWSPAPTCPGRGGVS